MKNNLFFHTVPNQKFYHLLIEAGKLHLKKKLKITKIYSEQIKRSKLPSLSLFFFLLKNILSFNIFFVHNFISLKYKSCYVGRYAASETFRLNKVIDNKLIKSVFLLKNLIRLCMIVDNAYKVVKFSKAIYIDHVGYSSGIYIKIFSDYKKIVYFNGWPRGFSYINYKIRKNQKINDSNIIIIRPSKKDITKFKINKALQKIEGIIKKPKKNVHYLKYTKFDNLFKNDSKKIKNVDYVIYAHSFVDAQLFYGYDGFANLYEWLDFTIDFLLKRNKNILVKGHPNFYNKTYGSLSKQDLRLFEKIIKKYSNTNVIFINKPMKNDFLLKKIRKDTVIISHHGTAILETSFLGFKTICSKYCLWDYKFHVSNQWSNIDEYKILLEKKYQSLNFYKSKKLLCDLIYQIYFNKYAYYKAKSFQTIIERNAENINRKVLIKNYENVVKYINTKKVNKIISDLSLNIEEVKID